MYAGVILSETSENLFQLMKLGLRVSDELFPECCLILNFNCFYASARQRKVQQRHYVFGLSVR